MRLEDWEIEGIVSAIEYVFRNHEIPIKDTALYLYGSRVDDQKRGGDIDLMLRVPAPVLHQVKDKYLDINFQMQRRIGEQKIDLLIFNLNPPEDPFHRLALKQAVLIQKWQ